MSFHFMKMIVVVSLLVYISCNKGVKPQPDPVQDYAVERFGNDFVVDYNESKEYVILSKAHKIKPSDPFPTLRFEVIEVSSMEVIFNDNLRGGKVSWIRDFIVEAEAMKGIPNPDNPDANDNVYRYNVQKRKRFTGGFF
ncbi:MAG: hypothetical protein HKN09_07525 [Saprospiraceae bacterium]|nr:hypothetical protein [Saprospiraceae bacterium]